MNNTQAVLAALAGVQSNVQSSLPVIPNNGNPAGAYNMSQPMATGTKENTAQAADPWPWLQPSPFMATLQQDLQSRSERLRHELAASNQMQAPVMPMPVQQPAPIPVQPTVGSALQNMISRQNPQMQADLPVNSAVPIQQRTLGRAPVLPVRSAGASLRTT